MHIQLLHTSASLTINENWDPDVRDDMEMMLNRNVANYNTLIRVNNVYNVQAGAGVYPVEAQLRGPGRHARPREGVSAGQQPDPPHL